MPYPSVGSFLRLKYWLMMTCVTSVYIALRNIFVNRRVELKYGTRSASAACTDRATNYSMLWIFASNTVLNAIHRSTVTSVAFVNRCCNICRWHSLRVSWLSSTLVMSSVASSLLWCCTASRLFAVHFDSAPHVTMHRATTLYDDEMIENVRIRVQSLSREWMIFIAPNPVAWFTGTLFLLSERHYRFERCVGRLFSDGEMHGSDLWCTCGKFISSSVRRA